MRYYNTRKIVATDDTFANIREEFEYFHNYFAVLTLLRIAHETNNEELRIHALQCDIKFDVHKTLNDYLLDCYTIQHIIDNLSVRDIDNLIISIFERVANDVID